MSSLFLTPANFTQLEAALAADKWIVACLCAAWCDVCKQYRAGFDAIVSDLAPKNAALLAERDRIQAAMDDWHRAHPAC